MPDIEIESAAVQANGHLKQMNGDCVKDDTAALRDWNPSKLIKALYEVSYEPKVQTKRNRFLNMEGHVEVPSNDTNNPAELNQEWKQIYIRTKEGRVQTFATHYAGETPVTDILLSGADVDANREERTLSIHGGRERVKLFFRVPSNVFDKWRQAFLSHCASSQIDAYVKPTARAFQHLTERVVVLEFGSSSIRGGILTQEPSLPQSFFPAIAVRTDDGRIVVGEEAYDPQVRSRGDFVKPIESTDPSVERYTMDKDIVRACINRVIKDLKIDPKKYKAFFPSTSKNSNVPTVLVGELLTIALNDARFQGAAITRQPQLILYSYDIATGVVVDIGDRLNIVPVIDGYVVDSAICSLPYGGTQIRESLRSLLCANNKGLYSFRSPIEQLILRYVMEQTTYVPEDYEKEKQNENKEKFISLDGFDLPTSVPTRFNIDSSRFTCTEGLFQPKKWGLDTKGLPQLIHEAVQQCPIDSRRLLYRNIYLAGGASIMPGLAEKLEHELAKIVPNTIHAQVHISPWRYNAAYLGAQILTSAATFPDSCVTPGKLGVFLTNLNSASF
ncbi:hypothetical protein WR25_10932 [Diploscapter pachys]|uniref:Uncharacterized protein n=1 Tax=Diploscapter pachys TaxID=2018661 RepID=A0A2A2K7M9_9BILA|nr:hypothetical protein WR25_10932 [Diploscapter pachys]